MPGIVRRGRPRSIRAVERTPRPEDVDAIEAVAAHMESIAAPLAENDGVRRFNELYP